MNKILTDVGLDKDSVLIDNETIEWIINNYTIEGGIRKLEQLLYEIIRKINVKYMIGDKIEFSNGYYTQITLPLSLNIDLIKKNFFNKKHIYEPTKIKEKSQVGLVNGLYANTCGFGGILPIEGILVPTSKKYEIILTGNLGKTMEESIRVAASRSWNFLSKEFKKRFNNKIKNQENIGFHIHCPEAGIQKDGPSAGLAFTLLFYSIYTDQKIPNNIAMTGEINLNGDVMTIGGLKEKLEGANTAGVKRVFIPEGNRDLYNKILLQYPEMKKQLKNLEINIIKDFGELKKKLKFK